MNDHKDALDHLITLAYPKGLPCVKFLPEFGAACSIFDTTSTEKSRTLASAPSASSAAAPSNPAPHLLWSRWKEEVFGGELRGGWYSLSGMYMCDCHDSTRWSARDEQFGGGYVSFYDLAKSRPPTTPPPDYTPPTVKPPLTVVKDCLTTDNLPLPSPPSPSASGALEFGRIAVSKYASRPFRDMMTIGTDEYANLTSQLAAVTAERDAYLKAKAENDERFMIERDTARAERDVLRPVLDAVVALQKAKAMRARPRSTVGPEKDRAITRAWLGLDAATATARLALSTPAKAEGGARSATNQLCPEWAKENP